MGVKGLRKFGNGTQFSNFLGVTVHELGIFFYLRRYNFTLKDSDMFGNERSAILQ